jgi:catechol 2,3-dioxygenase-like lactoylglutathione lyase family enzyme
MILGINHVQMTMPPGEEPTARAFYGELLGLNEIEKPTHLRLNGGLWFELGDRQLHLGCEELAQRSLSKAHVALNVSDAAYWRKHFTKNGVQIDENAQIKGYIRFDVRDPFGNRLEIMQQVAV